MNVVTVPQVRAPGHTGQILNAFVFASLPAAVIGVWNLGFQTMLAAEQLGIALPAGWRMVVMQTLGLGLNSGSVVSCFVYGLLHVLPLGLVAVATAYFWARTFSRWRGRSADPAWFMSAWLFILLLPPSTSLVLAAVAMSFGVFFGSHIFGGTGRYLVSPALLAVLFLHFGYPGFTQAALPLPGADLVTTWSLVAAGTNGSVADLGLVFWGAERGAIGTVSAAACLAGAAYLVYARAASYRTILGAGMGLVLAAWLASVLGSSGASALPWYWHVAIGNFAFAVAFLATDPTAAPLTAAGRWVHGVLLGVLTVALRVADPSHPEGALFAVLLAGLTIPLIDHLVVRLVLRRLRNPVGAS